MDLLRIEEAADLTGVPVNTLRYWRAQKPPQGPPSARLGRRVVYRRGDVEAWINAQFEQAGAGPDSAA